jgi:hypothetical protein
MRAASSCYLKKRAHIERTYSFSFFQYLRHLRTAEGGLNDMDSAQTGDLVENLR